MTDKLWHKSDEKPIYHKWACVKYPNAPVKPVCKFIEENTYISYACEYAYLDDLIAAADRAERLQNQNSVLLNYLMDFMHREKEYVAQYKTAKSVSTINGYHKRIKDHLHEIGIDD